jgi:transglutaminase-like putative cysteine protease
LPVLALGPKLQDTMSTSPRDFSIDCTLTYAVEQPSEFIFLIHALDGMGQQLLGEKLQIWPATAARTYTHPNAGHRFLRLQAQPGKLRLRYRATVRVTRPRHSGRGRELPIAKLPDEVLRHLVPTRYCESDLLGPAALKLFGKLPPGRARVEAISDWIHHNLDYLIGASGSTTTACDVFLRRAGVCRDFAHLGITFCRALNIPARLAVGYAVFDEPPPDFHAIVEVFLDGHWELFDPTGMSPPEDLVRIAVGSNSSQWPSAATPRTWPSAPSTAPRAAPR